MTDGTGVSGMTGTTTYVYDSLNRLQSVTDAAGNTVTYSVDPVGNDTCLSYPNSGATTCQNALSGTGLVTYGYDAANRTVSMADWVNPAMPTAFSYDNDSNLIGTTLSNTATTVTDSYDDTDALTGVSGVSTLARNADENILSTTPPSEPTITYGYDPLNRVTAGTIPNDITGATTSYTYDGASEITSATPSGGSTTDYEYNSDGQLCWTASSTASCTSPPTGATTNTYSSAGERASTSGSGSTPTTYQWDQAGNLVCETVTNSAGATCTSPSTSYTTSFTYNGDGLRMSATSPPSGTTTQCTWDVSGSVPRLLQAGSEDYLFGPNVGSAPIEQITVTPGSHQFLVSDPTGVRETLSSGGSLSASINYNSYGVPSGSPISLFGFDGGITDANGFIYLINRYYDPTTGQFISVDPDVASTGEPYAFAASDPVNNLDPSGRFESGPGGQLCSDEINCNSRAVPINSCGMYCAATGGISMSSSSGNSKGLVEPGVSVNGPWGIISAPELTISWSSSVTVVGQSTNPGVTLGSDGSINVSTDKAFASFSPANALVGLSARGGLSATTTGVSYTSTQEVTTRGGTHIYAQITASVGPGNGTADGAEGGAVGDSVWGGDTVAGAIANGACTIATAPAEVVSSIDCRAASLAFG